MYEQVSHSLLNRILNDMKPDFHKRDLRHFYTRLGANFYAIHGLFDQLYGKLPDFEEYMLRLVEVLAKNYLERPAELQEIDIAREEDHNWFLHQQWVGMALYLDGFAGNLQGLKEKIPIFRSWGLIWSISCPSSKALRAKVTEAMQSAISGKLTNKQVPWKIFVNYLRPFASTVSS